MVYRLGEESEEVKPVLQETIAGSASGWTPPANRCLERGGRYAWSVRALGNDTQSEWSPPGLFEVVSGPSDADFEEAFAVVQRYLEARGGDSEAVQTGPEAATGESSASGEPAADVPGLPTPATTQLSVDGGVVATSFAGDGSALTDVVASDLVGAAVVSEAELDFDPVTQSEMGTHAGTADAHHTPTIDTDTVLNETEVETFVTNGPLDGTSFSNVTAVAGDSATGFFSEGQIEEARIAGELARDTEVSAQALCATLLPSEGRRYLDAGDGTVLDCKTKLLWLKDASCAELAGTDVDGRAIWSTAESAAALLADGTCGLTDGSSPGDWRQPTISELCSAGPIHQICPAANAPDSLVDSSVSGSPKVANTLGDAQWSEGDAFVGVQPSYYWAKTVAPDPINAWYTYLGDGDVGWASKAGSSLLVWPVRETSSLGFGVASQADLDTHTGDADGHREHATLEESAEIDADIAAHDTLPNVHHSPTVDTNTDTLAGLSCTDGQIAKWNDSLAQWECAQDQTTATATLEEELCRLYIQTGELPAPAFCDLEPVNGSVDITGQPVAQVAVNPVTDRVYVGGNYSLGSQPLKVIDATDKTSPAVVTTLTGAGATANPSTNRFYAKGGTGAGGGTILVYNGADNSLITSVPVGYCGGNFDIDVTTNLIYMTSQCGAGNDPLHVLNGATNTLAAGPLGSGGVVGSVKVNSTTGNAYVSRTGGTRVFGPSPGFAFITDLPGLYIRAVNPVTNRLYFYNGSALEVRSGVDHSLVTTIAGVTGAFGVNTARNRVYWSDPTAQLVRVIDGATDAVIGDISLGTGVTPGTGAVDSTKNRFYITGTVSGSTRLYVVTDTVP
ncbi:MAG: DUF1566 domain-containing protein [Thermoanaerobaculia bacterium]